MAIKQQYFEAVDLVNELREEVKSLNKQYEEDFIYEPIAEIILERIAHRKKSISHLEEMMAGIREEVGRETMREWKREYMEKGAEH